MVLQDQGDQVAARRLYERALSIRERVLGTRAPDTAHAHGGWNEHREWRGDADSAMLSWEEEGFTYVLHCSGLGQLPGGHDPDRRVHAIAHNARPVSGGYTPRSGQPWGLARAAPP